MAMDEWREARERRVATSAAPGTQHQRRPDLELDAATQPQADGTMGIDDARRMPVEQAGQDRGTARREVAGEVARHVA